MALLISAIAFAAGIAAYLLYYNRSEHHLYPFQYMATYALAGITITATQHRFYDTPLVTAARSAFSLVGIFLTGTLLSVSIYRLFLSPLNKFPGPFFARLTQFHTVYRNRRLNSHHQLAKLHQKYGKIVRIGPNDLSISDHQGTLVISGPHGTCTKGPWYEGDYPLQSMHTTRDRAHHDRRRRVWAPAFSDKALRGYETRIKVYNDLLVKQINAYSGK